MAGHMGSKRVASMNLKIVKIDAEKHVLLVKGAVPGSRNSLVYIRKSIKKKHK
jgi:large subunit ribosomal protein L3